MKRELVSIYTDEPVSDAEFDRKVYSIVRHGVHDRYGSGRVSVRYLATICRDYYTLSGGEVSGIDMINRVRQSLRRLHEAKRVQCNSPHWPVYTVLTRHPRQRRLTL